ncbi:MAG TPA: hypothetical protein DD379_15665 [Cyanobacteria bacterium UBA11162]|nr:hypothetical protein [Cyanobacteria bacterium UBA11162]
MPSFVDIITKFFRFKTFYYRVLSTEVIAEVVALTKALNFYLNEFPHATPSKAVTKKAKVLVLGKSPTA